MDETLLWLISIIGPAILLVLLIGVVIKARGRGTSSAEERRSDTTTNELYDDEERRRREGTDDL